MGKVIGIIIAILAVVGIIWFVTNSSADIDTEGEFETPEVEVEGEFDAPEMDVDVNTPDLEIEGGDLDLPEVDIDVEGGDVDLPSVETEEAAEAEADADEPEGR